MDLMTIWILLYKAFKTFLNFNIIIHDFKVIICFFVILAIEVNFSNFITDFIPDGIGGIKWVILIFI